jgi:hypothetical protein
MESADNQPIEMGRIGQKSGGSGRPPEKRHYRAEKTLKPPRGALFGLVAASGMRRIGRLGRSDQMDKCRRGKTGKRKVLETRR